MPNIMKGTVTKVGAMRKTITVTIARRFDHPVLLKQMVRHKKMLVHDENEEAKLGQFVSIIHGKPISTRKHFRLHEIMNARTQSSILSSSSPLASADSNNDETSSERKSEAEGHRIAEILEGTARMEEGSAEESVSVSGSR